MQVILKKTASIIVVLFPFLGFFQKQMVILGFHTGGFIMKVTKIQKVFSQPEYSMWSYSTFSARFSMCFYTGGLNLLLHTLQKFT